MHHYCLSPTGLCSWDAACGRVVFIHNRLALLWIKFLFFSFQGYVGEKQHEVIENVYQNQKWWERIYNGYTHISGIFPKSFGGMVVKLLWQRQSGTCAFPYVNTMIWKVLYDSQKQLLLSWYSHGVLEIHLNRCIADSWHLFWQFGWVLRICLFTSDIELIFFIRMLNILFISLEFVDQS